MLFFFVCVNIVNIVMKIKLLKRKRHDKFLSVEKKWIKKVGEAKKLGQICQK